METHLSKKRSLEGGRSVSAASPGTSGPLGAYLPAPPGIPVPGSESITLSAFRTLINDSNTKQTTELKNLFEGRLDKVESEITAHSARIDSTEAQITQLQQGSASQADQIIEIKQELTALRSKRASSVPARSTQRDLEAFLGGFPNLRSNILQERAAAVVGSPEGLVKISVPSGAGNCAFIRFESPELMQTFVQSNWSRIKAQGFRLKRNQSPERRSQNKLRYKILEEGKTKLVAAGVAPEDITVNGGKIWRISTQGEATLLAKIVDNVLKWEPSAPAAASN